MKSGFKTTEFWLKLLGVMAPAVASQLPQDNMWVQLAVTVVTAVVGYFGPKAYAANRTDLKKAALSADY